METNKAQSSPNILFTIDSSGNITELLEALSLSQSEFPVIPKDSEVQVYSKPPDRKFLYSYKYADLTTIIDCTRPSLTKNGMSFSQDYLKHPLLGVGIATLLFHKSGQWLKSGFVPCSIQGLDMKAIAGQFTYGKRISLTAALGVSGDEDVDAGSIEAEAGNATEKTQEKKNTQQSPPPRETKPPSKMDELLSVVSKFEIKHDLMPQIIMTAIGEKKRSADLAPLEVDQVISYINELYGSKAKF